MDFRYPRLDNMHRGINQLVCPHRLPRPHEEQQAEVHV
jgi:hypothetical protein